MSLDLCDDPWKLGVAVQDWGPVLVQHLKGIDPATVHGVDDVTVSAEQVELSDRIELVEKGLNQE